MRLNLKNASITKIDQGKWRLVYDISKLNKPRLSPDARLYIEYLNLPEFIDDTWGAIVSAVLETTGKVQSITLTNAGLGYLNATPPTITIDPAPVGTGAVNAVANLVQLPNLYTTNKPKRFVFQIKKDATSVDYQVILRNDLFPSAGSSK